MRHALPTALLLAVLAACSDSPGTPACDAASCDDADRTPSGRGGDTDAEVDTTPDVADTAEDADADVTPRVCEPGVHTTCYDATSVQTCNAEGTGYDDPVPCGEPRFCEAGVCQSPPACDPGPLDCADRDTLRVCLEDGRTVEERPCDPGLSCVDGECIDALCDPEVKSYIGCEFWAVDLDNHPDAGRRPVVIAVSNTNPFDVTVSLTNLDSLFFFEDTLGAGKLETYTLNGIDLDDTSLTRRTFHVEATGPITVHQLNPANNSVEVFSNDASLLLPSGAIGEDYIVLTWPTISDDGEGKGFLTIVGTEDGTAVTITPTADIDRGRDVEGIPAGEARTVRLDAGDVLSLTTTEVIGADLSGTVVSADAPVAVFAGSECAFVPMDTAWCDHLEQQLYPVDTWGTTYVAGRFAPRGDEPSVFRVVAARDDTTLSTVPEIPGLHGVTLNRGDVAEAVSAEHFLLSADQPIALGQFMVGAEYPGLDNGCTRPSGDGCAIPTHPLCERTAIGDPAYLLGVPTAQFRDEYLVLVPDDYVEDHFTVVLRTGTALTLDGAPVDTGRAEQITGTDWSVLWLDVTDGNHEITGDSPFGLSVHGYDCDVSYAYPGGLDLEPTE